MKTSKKDCAVLFALFVLIFAVKTLLSFLLNGPFLFADEACVVAKAVYFSEHLGMVPCSSITMAGDGDPFPLYSILIFPIYRFFSGMEAYYAVLVFNSLITALLVFPLYSIFNFFLKDKRVVFMYTITILFLSEVFIFEKMLMTEILFIVLNIWFLFFYLRSFLIKGRLNKAIALFLTVLAAITRPFGFILPLAVAVNEFVQSKSKIKSLSYFVLATVMFLISTMVIWRDLLPELYSRMLSLKSGGNFLLFLEAVKNQVNSFTLATFVAPLLLFLIHIWEKDSEPLRKIRYFLIAFIVLNFIVSVQHIYAYYLAESPMDLMTRYINMSLIYIFIFSLIFLSKYKSFIFNLKNILIISAVIFPLFYLSHELAKYSQNLDLSPYFHAGPFNMGEDIRMSDFLNLFFWPVTLVLLSLLLLNKRKLLTLLILTTIFVHAGLSFRWMKYFVAEEKIVTYDLFKDENFSILFLERPGEIVARYYFWNHIALTHNRVYAAKYHPGPDANKILLFPMNVGNNIVIEEPDVIVTMHELDYPEVGPDYLEMNIYAPKLAQNDKK